MVDKRSREKEGGGMDSKNKGLSVRNKAIAGMCAD